MENFVVSARKYRPATFRSVVGQQHVTTTLQNAIQSQHLAQAFLFCGPRGVGKTTCARILAKTINCTNLSPETEACGQCASCRAFQENASFNVHELDAASNNSVEDIRSLVEQVRYAPQAGKYKIYIIDEVHMLSNAAFNAFLKTLEEPPNYAIFILATTERHKIIPTILSRCQIFDFSRIRVDDMSRHLRYVAEQEGVSAEEDALHLLAQKADGGLRDALSMFDQMVTFGGNNLTYKEVVQNLHVLDYDYYFRLIDSLLTENLSAALLLLDEVMQQGFDLHNFVVGTAEHLRGLLVCKDAVTVQLLEVSEGIRRQYVAQAQAAPVAFLLSALNLVSQCDREFKQAKNQRLHVELVLMKLAYLNGAVEFVREHTGPAAKKKADGVAPATAAPAATAASPPPAASSQPQAASPKLQAPSSQPQAASSKLQAASSKLQAASFQPQAPSFQPQAPTSQAPSSQLQAPTSQALKTPSPQDPTTNAPADGPTPLPVANQVTELHDTPSIEAGPDAAITPRHQLRDTLPHVEVGVPSFEGIEPGDQNQPRPAAAPKIPILPTGKLPSLNGGGKLPSLKDLGKKSPGASAAAAVAEPPPTSGPVAAIAPALLEKVWREIADERRAQDRMSEYWVLNRPVAANAEHQIELTVDNPVQEDQFNQMRTEFLGELRRRTGHPRLNVQVVLNTAVPTGRKLYTNTDKFEYLAEKFPALREAKQRLGLENDF